MTYVQMILFGNEELIILRWVKFYHRICTTMGFYFHLTFFFFFVCVFAPAHIHDLSFWIINGLWKRKTMYSIFNKSKIKQHKTNYEGQLQSIYTFAHLFLQWASVHISHIWAIFFLITPFTHCALNNNIEHYIFCNKKWKTHCLSKSTN